MRTVVLKTDEAQTFNKWAALQDRKMRNTVNSSLFTDNQKLRLERMKIALGLVVKGMVYDISYGKRGAGVKLQDGYQVVDSVNLALLEQDWEKDGIFRKVTAQGTTYYMPR
jgi:hypothetical protein